VPFSGMNIFSNKCDSTICVIGKEGNCSVEAVAFLGIFQSRYYFIDLLKKALPLGFPLHIVLESFVFSHATLGA
jgi:hypothetical protein